MDSASLQSDPRPVIGVTMGDPGGIGPEVVVRALADRTVRRSARFVVYGQGGPLLDAAERCGIEPFWWRTRHGSAAAETAMAHDVVLLDHDDPGAGRHAVERGPTRAGGAASFAFVEHAIADALPSRGTGLDAIVTAPISKEAWAMAGRSRWPGHTELLTSRFGAKRTRMLFVTPDPDPLRVALVTAHLPLMDLRNVHTIGRVFDTIDLAHQACRDLGIERPRIGVAGLNPHAGEGGLLGDEERRLLEPAVKHAARDAGIDVEGPLPGDTIFRAALRGRFDMVVAMYHDQGLIPVKLLAFDRAVNLTYGLPVPRTSPDHGTAFDIAGRCVADPGSMLEAVRLAVRLARPAAAVQDRP